MNAIDGGFHPVAIDANNHIIGVGSAHPCTGMTPANIALGIWQIMALVTSQKFLADISNSLGHIGREIQEIKNWLTEEPYSQIEGNLFYLHSIAPVIASQNYDERQVEPLYNQLETIIRGTHELLANFNKRRVEYDQRIESLRVTGRGYEQHKSEIEDLSEEIMRFAHYRAAMLRVWGMATQLQCALPLDTSLPASHLAKLHLICDNQASNQKQLYKAMASKIASLESTKWNPQQLVKSKKEEMHRKDKRELQGQLAKNNKKATAYLKETSDAVKEAQELLQAQTKPTYGSVRLIVTLDETAVEAGAETSDKLINRIGNYFRCPLKTKGKTRHNLTMG